MPLPAANTRIHRLPCSLLQRWDWTVTAQAPSRKTYIDDTSTYHNLCASKHTTNGRQPACRNAGAATAVAKHALALMPFRTRCCVFNETSLLLAVHTCALPVEHCTMHTGPRACLAAISHNAQRLMGKLALPIFTFLYQAVKIANFALPHTNITTPPRRRHTDNPHTCCRRTACTTVSLNSHVHGTANSAHALLTDDQLISQPLPQRQSAHALQQRTTHPVLYRFAQLKCAPY